MTHKKNDNNRKQNNKITIYLTDSLRDYLAAEVRKRGKTRSLLMQEALSYKKDSTQ